MIEKNQEEQNYLNLLKALLEKEEIRSDRTGIGTLSLFGSRLRFSLEDGRIPLLTTKKVSAKNVIEELLFFVRGETQTKKLEEKGINIWKGNTNREFLDKRGLIYLPEGDMGKSYGFQWRDFGGVESAGLSILGKAGIDQLKEVLNSIKNDPYSRRHIVIAWNPEQLDEMCLPPCHLYYQFYVQDNKLSCQFVMRSVDTLLGLPYNLASYAILTHIMAKAAGLDGAKELIFVGGDTHLYSTHLEQAKEQITRSPFNFPQLKINKDISSIEDMEKLEFKDFEIVGYEHHPVIKASMAI